MRAVPSISLVNSPLTPESAESIAGDPGNKCMSPLAGAFHSGSACRPPASWPDADWKAASVAYPVVFHVIMTPVWPAARCKKTRSSCSVVPVVESWSTRIFPCVRGHFTVPPAPLGQLMALSTLMLLAMVKLPDVPSTLMPAETLSNTLLPIMRLPVTFKSSMPWSPVMQPLVLPVLG